MSFEMNKRGYRDIARIYFKKKQKKNKTPSFLKTNNYLSSILDMKFDIFLYFKVQLGEMRLKLGVEIRLIFYFLGI